MAKEFTITAAWTKLGDLITVEEGKVYLVQEETK
jgi:hypothetical protein